MCKILYKSSVSFWTLYIRLWNKEDAKYVIMDAGYKTLTIARMIIEDGKESVMSYTRPMTKDVF